MVEHEALIAGAFAKVTNSQIGSDEERLPGLFIRGAASTRLQLNVENPVGTMQSIEYALRSLDIAAADDHFCESATTSPASLLAN